MLKHFLPPVDNQLVIEDFRCPHFDTFYPMRSYLKLIQKITNIFPVGLYFIINFVLYTYLCTFIKRKY